VAGESRYIIDALKQSAEPWFIKGIKAVLVSVPPEPAAISVASLNILIPQSAAASALTAPKLTRTQTSPT
jgi:hypothetical protein